MFFEAPGVECSKTTRERRDVTKVTYYMYSCDTCCMISEMMEMNDLD